LFCFCCCDTISDKSILEKRRDAAGHIVSSVRDGGSYGGVGGWGWWGVCVCVCVQFTFSLLLSPEPQSMEWYGSHSRWAVSPQLT
jgi:hypothetical protein